MGACLCIFHVSSFLLLQFLFRRLDHLLISFTFFASFFHFVLHLFALHRSWLHVLVGFRSFSMSVFFPSALSIESYTAMISRRSPTPTYASRTPQVFYASSQPLLLYFN